MEHLKLLIKMGWKQVYIAKRMDVDPNTVSRWLKGTVEMSRMSKSYARDLVMWEEKNV